MSTQDFLFEILTEELPTYSVASLSQALKTLVTQGLDEKNVSYADAKHFATPRRLAILITSVATTQPEQSIERKGPAVTAAFDADGKPTPACQGFAKSCNTSVEQLDTLKTDKGEWLFYRQTQPGQNTADILPSILEHALNKLPIAKRMRWGSSDINFVRPIKSILALFGQDIIPCTLLDITTSNITCGHRFLSPEPFAIKQPSDYEALLEEHYVIASFDKRVERIEALIAQAIQKNFDSGCYPVLAHKLLHEVTALVEWPEVLVGQFSPSFLTVPTEALITSMQEHQKCFAIKDGSGNLLPHFILVSNLRSSDHHAITRGNERVMRARLSDAKFFYQTDCEYPLEHNLKKLSNITYQAKLGSLLDKVERLKNLSHFIIQKIGGDEHVTLRAASLCKADLVSQMVYEFPELQGTMGRYYALNDAEPAQVANAIYEHYLPRNANDQLPESKEGSALAIAERLDTLVGIFGINMSPTGDKDPYGLRRAALGLLKILIEHRVDLDLEECISFTLQQFPQETITNTDLENDVAAFLNDRLKAVVQALDIDIDVYLAVMELDPQQPYIAFLKMRAIQSFKKLPESQALASANKRVRNLLAKQNEQGSYLTNEALFETPEEKKLFSLIQEKEKLLAPLIQDSDYDAILNQLAELKETVDNFFDNVMIMVDDQKIKTNRLALLNDLRKLFLTVGDIALLQ